MVTVDELSPGHPLPAPMVVEVTDVEWHPEHSRRAVVEVVDSAGNPLRLIDYEGANLSTSWTPTKQYRISNCSVNPGGEGWALELAPGTKTEIEPVTTPDQTQLLVLGDTHIGRETHPASGEPIDPIATFQHAVDYGCSLGVDAVIHVGDIFHESAGPAHTARVQQDIFAPLRAAKTPFYYVRGNHGSESGDELLAEIPGEYVAKLDASGTAVGSDVRVYGVDHHEMGEIPWEELHFPREMPDAVSILVLHQTLEQLSGPDSESVDLADVPDRALEQFDVILSGHHHDAFCRTWWKRPVIYTGAAERMSTVSEPNDRVAWLIRVENGTISYERYDIP